MQLFGLTLRRCSSVDAALWIDAAPLGLQLCGSPLPLYGCSPVDAAAPLWMRRPAIASPCDCIALRLLRSRLHPVSPLPRRANGAHGTRGVAERSLAYNGVGISWMELESVGWSWMEPGL